MRSATWRWALTLLTGSVMLGACGQPPARIPRHTVTIQVESDPGMPLAGVAFDVEGAPIGTSDEHGLVHTILEGREGTTIDIHHACPEGYSTEDDTQSLALISFQSLDPEAQNGLRMTVRCTPINRQAAFIIDAGGHAGLPVLINGNEVGVTDEAGIAQVVIDTLPNRNFRVELATADFERLRPRNPTHTFNLGARSDVFVFQPEITEEAPPVRRRRRRRRRSTPMRIIRIN